VAAVTIKACALLVPAGVVTVTARGPADADASTAKVAVSDVALTTVTLEAVAPAPLIATVAPVTKFVPVRVAVPVVPAVMLAGATADRVGCPAAGVVGIVGVEGLAELPVHPVNIAAASAAIATNPIVCFMNVCCLYKWGEQTV
jgi:hypothetical protein